MEKLITIPYTLSSQNTDISICVSYNITVDDNIQTITCNVISSADAIPLWLQPHKFEIKSKYRNGIYETLFNYDDRIKSLDAALFIDKVYADIMTKEKFKVKKGINA